MIIVVRSAFFAVVISLLIVTASYESESVSETPECLPKELLVYMRAKAINLDPSQVVVYMDNQISMTAFGQLVSMDEYENLKPYLAKRWEISSNGLEYTFDLDPRFRFSNGQPITAKDVAFSIHRLFSKTLSSKIGAYLFGYSIIGSEEFSSGKSNVIKGIVVRNNLRISFKLSDRKSNFLSMLATGSASIVPDSGVFQKLNATDIISSGPFIVNEFSNSRVVLTKNKFHPNFDGPSKIIFEFDSHPTCEVLSSKKFDLVDAGPYDGSICVENEYRMSRYSGANIWFIAFGKTIDPDLRKLIVRCVDKSGYFSVMSDANTSATSLNGLFPSRSNRNATALSHLTGKGCTLRKKKKLVLEAREQHQNSEALLRLFSSISNLTIELKKVDDVRHREARQNGNYDLLFMEFTGTFSDPTYYSSLFYSRGPLVSSGYRSTEYDTLVERLTHVRSSRERTEVMSKIENYIKIDPPAIFLKQHDNLEWTRKSLGLNQGGWFNRYFFISKNENRGRMCK